MRNVILIMNIEYKALHQKCKIKFVSVHYTDGSYWCPWKAGYI